MKMEKIYNGTSKTFSFSFVFHVFLVNLLILQWLTLVAEAQAAVAPTTVKVGVVLDEESMDGKIGLSCIKMALSDFYASHPLSKSKIVLQVRHSKADDILLAAADVLDLVKSEKVAAVIGPETSPEAQFVISIGEKAQVPIMSYSATSPYLSSVRNPYFIQATHDDSSLVQPLSALVQAFGWRQVVPIYVDNEFGGGIIPSLVDVLQQIGTRVLYRSVIPSSPTDDQIEAELYKLKSMQTRVFIVHMTDFPGYRLFLKAEQLGMLDQDYVWIVTSALADVLNSANNEVIQSMQGVLGVKTYIPTTKKLKDFIARWKLKFQQEEPAVVNAQMNIYGLWAYDAATALARAVEEVGLVNFTFQSTNNSANVSNDLTSFGISTLGPQLLQTILTTKFRGMSGLFSLVNGQLVSSAFEITNVVGNGEKRIGYWTPSSGLVRELNLANTTKYSTLKDNLRTIIWPGDSVSPPKGWVPSPNGKKLRIGVPFKQGFSEFVKVTRDPATNETKVSGYCIDVFDTVMAKLLYPVPYEYIAFVKPDFTGPAGDYDALIYNVHLQNFDAVVGDITIVANRSLYVDFALPYTESDVIMIAPVKDNKRRRAWLFLKPLTLDLWVTAFCFFIFIAFIIWVLEHRINEDFRGPPQNQIGTSLYYSFSSMVFAHSFGVFSNLTRFVVIIWVFVLLILTQSYTANLASLLTVEQLQPTITDVNELKKSGYQVGFQQGSFVGELLIQKGFKETQLTSFNSTEHLDELLTNGIKKGGIAAAYDEIPYVKVFLDKYCGKYTTVPPTYKTDGFGFAFPIGSPLVSDVSRMVLNVTEGEEMTAIEKKWLQQKDCQESTTSTSGSLGLDSFLGLFTIAGVAATLSLVIYLAYFLHDHRHVWTDRSASIWTRIKTLCRIHDQRNLSSHTFKNNSPLHDSNLVGSSPITPYPESPLSVSHESSERALMNYEYQSSPPSVAMVPMDPDSSTLQAPEDTANRQD